MQAAQGTLRLPRFVKLPPPTPLMLAPSSPNRKSCCSSMRHALLPLGQMQLGRQRAAGGQRGQAAGPPLPCLGLELEGWRRGRGSRGRRGKKVSGQGSSITLLWAGIMKCLLHTSGILSVVIPATACLYLPLHHLQLASVAAIAQLSCCPLQVQNESVPCTLQRSCTLLASSHPCLMRNSLISLSSSAAPAPPCRRPAQHHPS